MFLCPGYAVLNENQYPKHLFEETKILVYPQPFTNLFLLLIYFELVSLYQHRFLFVLEQNYRHRKVALKTINIVINMFITLWVALVLIVDLPGPRTLS